MRIAIVDSSRTVLHIVGDLLVKAGHEVQPFTDGFAALKFIRQNQSVRTLITSAEPNSISGIKLCSEARKVAGVRRPLYIILMSSRADHQFVVQALDHGADDFLHKPPDVDELKARLRAAERLTSMQDELVRLARTDPLTRLYNRRAFFEHAVEMLVRREAGNAVSAIMVDIDHFKMINDRHGHQTGDDVLRAIAAEIATIDGLSGRLGGEEFCILLEGTLADAADAAEELRRGVRELRFVSAGQLLRPSCSFGVADSELGDDIDRLLHRADLALYEAKRAGRDRVVLARSSGGCAEPEGWRGVTRSGSARIRTS